MSLGLGVTAAQPATDCRVAMRCVWCVWCFEYVACARGVGGGGRGVEWVCGFCGMVKGWGSYLPS